MADLLTAAQTQIKYAENELKSGDSGKAFTHLQKAKTFIERAAHDEGRNAEIDAAADEASNWSGTWQEAYDRWLDAADEVLIAAGKPAGREGAERGAMDREESIALAKKIGVYDELEGLWGPEPGPGVSA
jgi:hypothetical protein